MSTVAPPPRVAANEKLVIYIEDDEKARETVQEAVERHKLPFVSVNSVAAANELLEDPDFRFGIAFIDQRLPRDAEGQVWAYDGEVDKLATRLAERGPIVWLTAHEVDGCRMDFRNAQGQIQKTDDVSGAVEAHLTKTIGPPAQDLAMDEVLVELSDLRPDTVTVRVPTWRPDDRFAMKVRHLESWIITVLRESGRAYFSARGWLAAERPLQLDLTDWHHIPPTVATDESFWDDVD